MGVIVKQKVKGKGNPWWIFIAHNKKRKSLKVGDKAAAEVVASRIRAKLKNGEYDFGKKKEGKLFKDYAKSWVGTTATATCKASTVSDYSRILESHVLPIFGDRAVDIITKGAIKDFLLGKVNEGFAGSTVTHMKNVISGVLNKAVDDETIQTNPAHKLGKIFKTQDKRKDVDFLTKEELKRLLDIVQVHFPRHYPLFLLLARTGLRIGEALALQWGDIDFNGRFITIQRGISRGRIETPKNGKSRRVDMSLQLTEALKALKDQGGTPVVVPITRNEGAPEEPSEWVFTNGVGGFIDVNNWRRRVFNKALKKAGLRRIRIHDLRHTYASLLIQAGESLAYVRDQLGHHSIKVTVDIYGHLAPEGNKQAVDKLDDVFPMHLDAPSLHPAPSENKQALRLLNLSA
jgi:integrase